MNRFLPFKAVCSVWGLLCLAMCGHLSADEPPTNNAEPVTANVDTRLGTYTVFNSLNAIQLVANTDLIGAELAQVDDVLRSHLGLDDGKGLVITSVADGGPAANAGIQKFDVLVSVGGQEIAGLDAFRKALEASPDMPIEVAFIRAGKKQAAPVTPRAATAGQLLIDVDPSATSIWSPEEKYWLGVGVAAVDDTLRSQLSLLVGGLVVTSVENESPAAKAGVMVNDVLLNLDGRPLCAVHELSQRLQEIGNKPVSLELLRRGKPAALTVAAEKHAVFLSGDFAPQPLSYRVVVAPHDLPTWTTVGQPAMLDVLVQAADNATAAAASPATQNDLAKQIDELEAQLKQLEASLASLRSSLKGPRHPADGAGKTESPK